MFQGDFSPLTGLTISVRRANRVEDSGHTHVESFIKLLRTELYGVEEQKLNYWTYCTKKISIINMLLNINDFSNIIIVEY